MAFGNTEERLSQFGNKRQILNAIREHYLMKREADHGCNIFIGFFTRLAEFHSCKALLPSGEDGGGLWRALRRCCLRTWGPAQAPAFPAHAGLSCSVRARA